MPLKIRVFSHEFQFLTINHRCLLKFLLFQVLQSCYALVDTQSIE